MVNSITNPNGLKLDDLGKLIDTPDNIDDLSDEQIAELCDSFGYVPKAESRVKFIRHFYKMLGFQISNDLLYALADEPKAMLMLAPAGGGKTTTVTAIIDCCKMLRKRKNKKANAAVYDEQPAAGSIKQAELQYKTHNDDSAAAV